MVIAAGLLPLAAHASAPHQADPAQVKAAVETVRAVFAEIPRPASPELLSPRLRLLFRQDSARRDRRLDFEWRSGGQERADLTGLHIRAVRSPLDAPVVEASFFNHGERRFRRFYLIRSGDRLVVNDVLLVPENGRLSALLRAAR
jgi:hypothetical protein